VLTPTHLPTLIRVTNSRLNPSVGFFAEIEYTLSMNAVLIFRCTSQTKQVDYLFLIAPVFSHITNQIKYQTRNSK